jgi:uncharacterized protein YihD (DUF1040 family)
MANVRLSDLQEKILIFVLQKKFATSQKLIKNFWGDTRSYFKTSILITVGNC